MRRDRGDQGPEGVPLLRGAGEHRWVSFVSFEECRWDEHIPYSDPHDSQMDGRLTSRSSHESFGPSRILTSVPVSRSQM